MVYNMENAEEVMQILERYTRLKQKEIPKELDEYLQYVAKTGDTVFKWSSLKYLFREKLLNVIKNFHDTSSTRGDEIPQYPNVDPFNYESMKSALLERLELFNAAPFTIQRLCELLIDPHKQYSRIDKFMRALEKNILVVSTIEPGRKRTESENGDSLDSVVNGDLSLDVNVDIDMENETMFNSETQNGNGPATTNAKTEPDATVEIKVDAENTEVDTNSLRSADDDILPNPKKLKLDIDEKEKESENVEQTNDVKTETKTEEKQDDKVDSEKTDIIKSNDEEKITDDNNETNDCNNDADMSEEKQNNDIETEKIENSSKISEEKKEVSEKQESEQEKTDDEKKTDEISVEKITDEVVENVKPVEDKVDSNNVITEQEETKLNNSENNTVIEEEKIIEKQEIEKCEKEELSATVPSDVDVLKTIDNKDNDAKQEDTTETIKTTEEPTTETKQNNIESGTNSVEETIVVKETESADAETVEKVDACKNETCDIDEKKEIESDKVGEKESLAPKTEDAKTEEENVNKEIETESATTTATDLAVEQTGVAVAEVTEQLPVTAEESDKVIVEAVHTTEEIKIDEISKTDENSKTDNIVVTPPTITLNDQPMEDSSVDDGSPVAEVNMVVESSDSANAMATDSTQPNNKDDPAKMEVDETSQEAMDQ